MMKQILFVVLVVFCLPTIAIGEDTSTRQKVETAYDQGVTALEKGNVALAISSFSKVIRLDPKLAMAYYGRGVAYDRNGEYDKAIVDYSEAIRLDPKDAQACLARGVGYERKGAYDMAIADFSQAIRLNPDRKR